MPNGFGRLRLAGIALIAAALGAAVPGARRLLRRGEPDPGQPIGNPGRLPAIQP
jgi:hypothetical protein